MVNKPMVRVFTGEDLRSRCGELSQKYEIIGPRELPNKGIFYQSLQDLGDLYLGEGFATEPIKKFFLPSSECLFRQRQGEEGTVVEDQTLPDNKRIVLGVRPCEARGLSLLDKVFDSEYKDEFYINNRRRTVVVGLACNRPDKSCFCTSLGGSPVGDTAMDVLLNESGDKIIAEILTARGEEIFGVLGDGLDETQGGSLETGKKERADLVTKKVSVPAHMDESFESGYWQRAGESCISCGICTYLCPTCHCFDLVDEKRQRLRCYDGCSFPDFTLEASGENPRPTKCERYRQRVFHKFSYFNKNFGEQLCVGCGRCIRFCPVKIDISESVAKIPSPETP